MPRLLPDEKTRASAKTNLRVPAHGRAPFMACLVGRAGTSRPKGSHKFQPKRRKAMTCHTRKELTHEGAEPVYIRAGRSLGWARWATHLRCRPRSRSRRTRRVRHSRHPHRSRHRTRATP